MILTTMIKYETDFRDNNIMSHSKISCLNLLKVGSINLFIAFTCTEVS